MPHVVAASTANESSSNGEVSDEQPKKLKPCCACPETKRARDQCIIEKGAENCRNLIEEHRECMRKLGFNI